jgi:hypothetical protein
MTIASHNGTRKVRVFQQPGEKDQTAPGAVSPRMYSKDLPIVRDQNMACVVHVFLLKGQVSVKRLL